MRIVFYILLMTYMVSTACQSICAEPIRDLGNFARWAKVEIPLTGPAATSTGDPNPFDIAVEGVFTSPGGRRIVVPGFYDGNGNGGPDGSVWKLIFAADEPGEWSFQTRSRHPSLNENTGTFTVSAQSENAPGLYRWGRLEAVGTPENRIRYLKFRDGPYWVKAGCDDPENFLGTYRNYDALEKRKAAVDYLAERGINSVYIMSHNIDGDDRDVWPWLGRTAGQAKANSTGQVRFDVGKLAEWRSLFEHMQRRGVVVYLVLEDDSAWKGYDHARYYREIIARFGDLPGLIFNLGEEHNENYKLADGLALAQQLADLDPYDHPRGIHNVNAPNNDYIDAEQIDFTSIQTGSPGTRHGLENALQHNQLAIDWLHRCETRGRRRLMVNFDEGRPEEQRTAWWAAYMAGGVWEAHVLPPYDRPMSAWDPLWTELGGARAFMESIPFWEMQPHNELIKSGQAFCLAKPGTAYALYLPDSNPVVVELAAGKEYSLEWWNPANAHDGRFRDRQILQGGPQKLTPPGRGDWTARILERAGSAVGRTSDDTYFPPPESQGGWRKLSSAEDVRRVGGMDPQKLDNLREWLLQSDNRNFAATVIRHGQIVLEVERGNDAAKDARRVASCSKAICATVLAIASEQSQQGNTPRKMTFDDKAFDFIPWALPLSDPRKAQITVRQLLNHTSGITPESSGVKNGGPWERIMGHTGDLKTARLAFDPGTDLDYSTHGLYHAALVCENVTGIQYDRYAIESLYRPLGIESWTFETLSGDEKHGKHASHSLGLPAREMARIAYCMAHDGYWRDQQVIPTWFVRETAQPTHNVKGLKSFGRDAESWSHGWELPARLSDGRGKGIPADARFKPGSGGQLIAFVPSLDLVVTRQTGSSGSWEFEEYLRLACAAVLNSQ